jgi:hypothetical protein
MLANGDIPIRRIPIASVLNRPRMLILRAGHARRLFHKTKNQPLNAMTMRSQKCHDETYSSREKRSQSLNHALQEPMRFLLRRFFIGD